MLSVQIVLVSASIVLIAALVLAVYHQRLPEMAHFVPALAVISFSTVREKNWHNFFVIIRRYL